MIIALWHECKQGNSFGMYADEPMCCRVCREIPTIPPLRKIWTDDTPDLMLGARKLDRENFPMLTETWAAGVVRGE